MSQSDLGHHSRTTQNLSIKEDQSLGPAPLFNIYDIMSLILVLGPALGSRPLNSSPAAWGVVERGKL